MYLKIIYFKKRELLEIDYNLEFLDIFLNLGTKHIREEISKLKI